MTSPTEAPGSREAMEFLRAAAHETGVTIEEFDGILRLMWDAKTLPNGLAHVYSLEDAAAVREIVQGLPTDTAPDPRSESPPLLTACVAREDEAEDEEHFYDDEEDDGVTSVMPGLTPGPEDEAHNEWLASLTPENTAQIIEALRTLKPADERPTFDEIRDKLGL